MGKVLSHHAAASGVMLRARVSQPCYSQLPIWAAELASDPAASHKVPHPQRLHRGTAKQPDADESEDATDSRGGSGLLVIFSCSW